MRAILNVENWSRFTLLDSQTDIHCGAVLPRYQATNVYPGYREVMLGVGTEIFGGTCGTISWQVIYRLLFGFQSVLACEMSPRLSCQNGNNDWVSVLGISCAALAWFSDCGALSQAHRHVECSFQPQPLRHILGSRHDLQSGDLQSQQ